MRHSLLLLFLALPRAAHADAAGGAPVFIEDRPRLDPHDDGDETYLTLGVITAPSGGWFGVRAQLDAFSAGGWSFGTAGTLFGRGVSGQDTPVLQASGVAYLAFTGRVSHYLRVRAQLGYGERVTIARDTTTMTAATTREEVLDTSVLAIGRGTHDWSVLAGPVVQRAASGTTTMLWFGVQRRF